MPESGRGDMSISSKTRGLLGSGANPAAPNENEIWRYNIFERRALRSRHEAIYLLRHVIESRQQCCSPVAGAALVRVRMASATK
jgi:hypothetical protein